MRRNSKVARQSDLSGPPIAAGFLAGDVVSDNAAYRLRHNAKALTANTFAGVVPATAASLVDAAFTTGWFIDDEIHHRRLKRLHALPEELLAERLKTLDELDEMLRQKNGSPR